MSAQMVFAEYIWIDGTTPTRKLRSKGRLVWRSKDSAVTELPEWGFDGSSTNQAPGHQSDLVLNPVYQVADPIRGGANILVMCEVFNPDGTPHATNSRAILREILEEGAAQLDAMVGFEQEYTFFKNGKPLGWPEYGDPRPQGPYYCGIGASQAFGRPIVERHARICAEIGLNIYGINAEVMPGQWEYQIGYRGFPGDENDILTNCDQRWIANWLLERVAEEEGVDVSFDNKPKKGDWNGAGCHTNFSTNAMRNATTGKAAIDDAIALLKAKHVDHIQVYGANLAERLTGQHETCAITEFRSGVSDRGASIRIPLGVSQKGYGYLEDRRPGANSDGYLVAARILATLTRQHQFDARFEVFEDANILELVG